MTSRTLTALLLTMVYLVIVAAPLAPAVPGAVRLAHALAMEGAGNGCCCSAQKRALHTCCCQGTPRATAGDDSAKADCCKNRGNGNGAQVGCCCQRGSGKTIALLKMPGSKLIPFLFGPVFVLRAIANEYHDDPRHATIRSGEPPDPPPRIPYHT